MVGILDKIRKRRDAQEAQSPQEDVVSGNAISNAKEVTETKEVEPSKPVIDGVKPSGESSEISSSKSSKAFSKEQQGQKLIKSSVEHKTSTTKNPEQKKEGFFQRMQRRGKTSKGHEEGQKQHSKEKLNPDYKATLSSILVAPRVTEKTMKQTSDENVYVFNVLVHATKSDVKRAIEAFYDVTVIGVRILRRKPLPRRRGAIVGLTTQQKRAMVRLAKGDRIDFFEQAE